MSNHFLETRQGKNLIPRHEGMRLSFPVSANLSEFSANAVAGQFLTMDSSGMAGIATLDDVSVGLLADDGFEVLGTPPAGGTITNAGSGYASCFRTGGEYLTLTYNTSATFVPGTYLVLDANGLLCPAGTTGAGTVHRAICVEAPTPVPSGGLSAITDPNLVPPLLKGTEVGARAEDGFGPNPLTNSNPATLRGYMVFLLL